MTGGIAELAFHERPVIELLDLGDVERLEVNRDYAGYGWARVARLWLGDSRGTQPIDDALVLALHSMDDAPAVVADDVRLEFVLADRSVAVFATRFLEIWLPRLPRASAIVLAMCNPHRAVLRARADVPIHYAFGDVEAWLDEGEHVPGARIRLAAATWCTLAP